MKYSELKESLKKADGNIYTYAVRTTKPGSTTIDTIEIKPYKIQILVVLPETDELTAYLDEDQGEWAGIAVDNYLNTKFGSQQYYCGGWALTEQDAKATVEQIKSNLKVNQLVALKEKLREDGVTKEDLLYLIEEFK